MRIKKFIVFGCVLMLLLASLVITAYGASDNYKVHNKFRYDLFGSPRTYTKPTIGNNDHDFRFKNDAGSDFYLAPPTAEPYYNVTLYKKRFLFDDKFDTIYYFPISQAGTGWTYCGRWKDVNTKNPKKDEFYFRYTARDNTLVNYDTGEITQLLFYGDSTLLSE